MRLTFEYLGGHTPPGFNRAYRQAKVAGRVPAHTLASSHLYLWMRPRGTHTVFDAITETAVTYREDGRPVISSSGRLAAELRMMKEHIAEQQAAEDDQ